MIKNKIYYVGIFCLLAACGAQSKSPADADTPAKHAEMAARDLIETLGRQQTFAMLGWQVEPDYQPMEHCFDHWLDQGEPTLADNKIVDCEQHVKDLSRVYASYGVDANPVIFKSRYYWTQKLEFDQAWPSLVDAWKAQGGQKDDASYLKHPGCVEPYQTGWTGSDFFYGGEEHPICRAHKNEALEARQE